MLHFTFVILTFITQQKKLNDQRIYINSVKCSSQEFKTILALSSNCICNLFWGPVGALPAFPIAIFHIKHSTNIPPSVSTLVYWPTAGTPGTHSLKLLELREWSWFGSILLTACPKIEVKDPLLYTNFCLRKLIPGVEMFCIYQSLVCESPHHIHIQNNPHLHCFQHLHLLKMYIISVSFAILIRKVTL